MNALAASPIGVDLPAFEALGMADGPALLAGTAMLADRRVGISCGLNRISITLLAPP